MRTDAIEVLTLFEGHRLFPEDAISRLTPGPPGPMVQASNKMSSSDIWLTSLAFTDTGKRLQALCA
ncbi:MAG: hypothetical protein HN348_04565 [Proteobacteria bacterium]|nr:hypothetical protein [Pseudomonadota bacterium]